MTTPIAASDLLKTVLELGAEAPETKARCRYFNEDATPCCIVGQGLAKHGVDRDKLKEFGEERGQDWSDINKWTPIASYPIRELLTVGEDAAEKTALETLREIQMKQDYGAPWSVAIDPSVTSNQVLQGGQYQRVG